MIINYEEVKDTKKPIGWIYQDEGDKSTGLSFLIINDTDVFVTISTMGVGKYPNDKLKDPYGPHVIKRFYKGDTISFTVEEGDW